VELGFDSVLAATIGTGLLPFLIGDAVKALLAVLLISAAWRLVRTLSEETPG
jgi:biotin transporter BioY